MTRILAQFPLSNSLLGFIFETTLCSFDKGKKETIKAPSLYEEDFVYYNPTFKSLRSKKNL